MAFGYKPGSYRAACLWIALNDEPGDLDVHNIAGYVSTALVADVWEKDTLVVARAIYQCRRQEVRRAKREGRTEFDTHV